MQDPPPAAPAGLRGAFRTDDVARAFYSEGAGIFRIIPRAVAVPADLKDLKLLIRWASTEGVPLVPRGVGSGMAGGNVGPGVVLDLTQCCREAPSIDAEAAVAHCGASVTYRMLNAAAQPFGLHLPPDPSSGAFCTVGGMAATNAAGAHSVKYGAMRRWVRALDFLTADGQVGRARPGARKAAGAHGHPRSDAEERFFRDVVPAIRAHATDLAAAAPRTPKNASGYALASFAESGRVADLLVGSEGTLAIITALDVALAPLPAERTTLLVTLGSLEQVGPAVLALRPLGPSALELLDRTYLDFVRGAAQRHLASGTEAVLLVEFEQGAREAAAAVRGIATSVEIAEDAATVGRLWELRHLASPILASLPDNLRSLQVVEDGCVPPEKLARYITVLRAAAKEHGFEIVIFGHAGDGHLHANLLADVSASDVTARLEACLRRVTAEQIALEGTPSGEHGDGRLRAPFVERAFGASYADLCRRTRAAWDPACILNPGVKILPRGEGDGLDPAALKVGPRAPALPAGVAARLREIERSAGWGTFRLDLAR